MSLYAVKECRNEIEKIVHYGGIKNKAAIKLSRCGALEWILVQYKQKKPSDPTIAEKINTYKFSDYKEKVIDLLKKGAHGNCDTMKIINQMSEE